MSIASQTQTGSNSVLEGGSKIEEGGELGPMSMLPQGVLYMFLRESDGPALQHISESTRQILGTSEHHGQVKCVLLP